METNDWSGSPCPLYPDGWWVDDDTGELVNAETGNAASTPPKKNSS
jgi:hypothetical protein